MYPGTTMRFLVFGFISTFFFCAHAETPAITPNKTIVLFNGKDFDGWCPYLRENKYNDPKHVFSIKDG
jgi:hypothetical protein